MLEYLIKTIFPPIRSISKTIIRRICFSGKPKVVIAGTGRCASTLFTLCIARSYMSSLRLPYPKKFEKYLAPLLIEYVEDLRAIRHSSAPIIKTHDLYLAESLPHDAKSIFIYGDPLISAVSVAKVVYLFEWVLGFRTRFNGSSGLTRGSMVVTC